VGKKDRSKVIEGLKTASNGDTKTEALNAALSACGNRVFLLRSIYEQSLPLFQTRWTLSYLKGPLTLPQIQTLMASKKRANVSEKPLAAPSKNVNTHKPSLPAGIQEYFLPSKNSQETPVYKARVVGLGKLHFVDTKSKVDIWKEYTLAAPVSADGVTTLWDKAEVIKETLGTFLKNAPPEATYDDIPSGLLNAKNYAEFSKAFANYLYQRQTYEIYQSPDLKVSSKDNESEGDLRTRISLALREKRDQDVAKLRDTYQPKISSIMDKIKRAQEKAESKKTEASQKKFDSYISMGTTLLGAIFGRGRINKGTISQAGTSMRKAGQVSRGEQDAAQAEESVQTYQQQLNDLQAQMDRDMMQLQTALSPENIPIETAVIHPRKNDIAVEAIAILWMPADVS